MIRTLRTRLSHIAFLFAGLIALTLLAFPANSNAQVVGGTISGTIADSTGAAIPNASVLVHNDETGIRLLLRDTGILIDEVADSVATGSVAAIRSWAEQASVIYRRRRVPMDNVIALCEGLREASRAVLAPAERAPVDAALDTAIERLRWQRRIAGDARKRNRILQLLYKGA